MSYSNQEREHLRNGVCPDCHSHLLFNELTSMHECEDSMNCTYFISDEKLQLEIRQLTGHEALLYDLDKLCSEVDEYHFHDIRSTLTVPKVALREQLMQLVRNCENGRYDDL